MRYWVKFKPSNGRQRRIGHINSSGKTYVDIEREAMAIMRDFCDERSFKIYYYRKWNRGGESVYDVGSHTEFFIVKPAIPFPGDEDPIFAVTIEE